MVLLSTRAKNLFLILVLPFSLNGGLVLEYVVPQSVFCLLVISGS